MISLLKSEFRKFKSTYINSLSLVGMLLPLALVVIMFLINRDNILKNGGYNWSNFNSQLNIFFVFLVGPIITSFIAVFSVFYEYQQRTMKNMLISPHRRITIISSKLIYVSVFVVMEYAVVALFNVLFAFLLGFELTWQDIVRNSCQMILAGTTTIVLVPMMMSITLLFRSFIPGMVITVGGTISNILVLNWDKSYISPWATPVDLFMISGKQLKEMNLAYPLTSICIYLVLFVIFTLVYFNNADQTA